MRLTLAWPLAAVGAVVAWSAGTPDPAEARPQYRTAYRQVYPDDDRGGVMKCVLCHVPRRDEPDKPDTKRRNAYGRKLEEALGEKNVKDKERIRGVLRELGPFPGDDKTNIEH